jgi:predicted XRE-type DNA-binding protein
MEKYRDIICTQSCAQRGESMDFLRIGDKTVSRQKLNDAIDEILSLRSKGLSQVEVATRLGVDRTFISRLESLGEIRKGGQIAIIGFPIQNCDEIRAMAQEEGVDFTFVMNDEERWDFVRRKSGIHLLNDLLSLINDAKRFDKVILIGSDKRLDVIKGLLDRNTAVHAIEIGRSPMVGDVRVNPEVLRKIVRDIKG